MKNSNKVTAAGCCRVSSRDQVVDKEGNKRQSLEGQEGAIRQYAKAHDLGHL